MSSSFRFGQFEAIFVIDASVTLGQLFIQSTSSLGHLKMEESLTKRSLHLAIKASSSERNVTGKKSSKRRLVATKLQIINFRFYTTTHYIHKPVLRMDK